MSKLLKDWDITEITATLKDFQSDAFVLKNQYDQKLIDINAMYVELAKRKEAEKLVIIEEPKQEEGE